MVELIEKPPPETGRLGAKVLSFPDVIAQSVGFMGPVFTSAFVIPLVVGVASVTGKGGGIASPLSVLIAGIGVFAIGWIVSSYAKEVRTAGSLYEYVSRGLGERIGTAAGGPYYAGVTMLTAAVLLILGGYLQSTIASEFSVNPLPGWAWSLIFLVIVALVLYFGVRISTRVQLVLALISIIVVTVFFISVIVKLGSANSFKPFRPSSSADGWPGIFFGVLYGILLFTGFESSANLAEQTPDPYNRSPFVMFMAGIATIFFVLATYVEVAGFHYSLKTLGAAASAPLFALGAAKSAGGMAAPGSTACSSSSFCSTCWQSGSAAASQLLAGFSRWPRTAGSRDHLPWCPSAVARRSAPRSS